MRFGTDVISGVPSIVMGIFAYTLIVLPQRHFSAFSGGAVLAFIMLPIIIRTTEEMLRLVPGSLREGSLALGATEWKTSLSVVLPAALNGVITGVMLAVARAAGEAAPMLFTAFGNPFMNSNYNQPVATLPHTIFVYAISPYPDWHAKAWATALVLIVLILMLNIVARLWIQVRARETNRIKNMSAQIDVLKNNRKAQSDHDHAIDDLRKHMRPTRIRRSRWKSRTWRSIMAKFRALADINLSVREKKITAIIGPSGCGKSTLLRSFNRMNDLTPSCRVAGRGHPGWRGHLCPRRGRGGCPPADRDGLPAAQPFPEIHLRQRRLRPTPVRHPPPRATWMRSSSAA